MHDYPAGRSAVWATAWLTGRTSYDEALDALVGDTAHRVVGLPGSTEAVPLGWALMLGSGVISVGIGTGLFFGLRPRR